MCGEEPNIYKIPTLCSSKPELQFYLSDFLKIAVTLLIIQSINNIFVPGDTFLIPNKTFMLMGGIRAYDLHSVTFQIGRTRRIILHIEM